MVGGSFGRPQVLQSLSNSAVFKSARSLLGSVAHLGIVMPPDTHHLPACGYDATHVWESEGGFSVCRLVRDRGIVPIPRSLPCYRAAPSLWRNQAWLAVGKRVVAAGSFAPGTDVLGQPGDVFDGEMRGQV